MSERIFQSASPEETEAIAAELAKTLSPGACIALSGELGAGKTRFVRGLVRGLGGEARLVNSPTFVLLNVYPARLTVYHLDAYRVGADDVEAIGFAELLEQGGVVVLEWAERAAGLLPARQIDVRIETVGEHQRTIHVSHG
ncbi:MAG TPA: tRNA (adenosine(37)-N6)-threonylcarbamoyltransferase complex ATPase subunit type 1 TsaE [Tepidisphaeraceae bacterium]|nr:tRNA (adenosine(37)-N6)-threonylcarbamoyltransferase complex ATPase subunit type 1 TsaE [Tepidisphaeraceae bacterium]